MLFHAINTVIMYACLLWFMCLELMGVAWMGRRGGGVDSWESWQGAQSAVRLALVPELLAR